MANITTVLGTSNLSTQIKPEVSSQIALITPWMQTPLASYLFKANALNADKAFSTGSKVPKDLLTVEKTGNQTFDDFEDEFSLRYTTVHGTSGGTAVGSATAANNTLIVIDSTIFKAGDLIAVYNPSGYGRREIAYIQSIAYSTHTLTLVRSTSFGTLSSAIALSDVVYKLSGAYGEGSGAPTILTTAKTKRTNYTQNFKATWGLTEQMKTSNTYTENEFAYQKKKALMQLMEDFELALWTGVPTFQNVADADGNKVSSTGGIFHGIRAGGGTATDAGANIVKSEVDTLIKGTYSSYGPSQKGRVFICSADAVKDFDTMITASGSGYQININAGAGVDVGYSVNMYKSSFVPGGIPILHSPVFDRQGIKGAVLLDLDTVKLKEFTPFRVDKINETENKQVERENAVGEYGLSRVMFKKNGYLKIDNSTEPIS